MSQTLENQVNSTRRKLASIQQKRQFLIGGLPFLVDEPNTHVEIPTMRMPMKPQRGMQPPIFAAPTPPSAPQAHVPPVTVARPAKIPAAQSKSVASSTSPRLQAQVQFYTKWLSKQTEYDYHRDRLKEIDDYMEEATKAKFVGKTKIATFAPFHAKLSALQTFTWSQFWAFSALGCLWLVSLYIFQIYALSAAVAAITVMYTFNLLLSLTLVVRASRSSPEEHIDDSLILELKDADWPIYTILCPLYREASVVPQFVKAMQSLDYPADKLQILFLTEENDNETRQAIRSLALPAHFQIIVVPDGQPRTKPRACNYGLLYTTGSYVVIYDAEDTPDPLQLKKAVLTFANHGTNVACVQAKLNFYNARQNILTRWFTAEYSTWFDIVLPSLQLARFSLPLGGTSNHFRVDMLRALGAWDAYNVTEDCDLGLRLKRYKLETVILDSTTLEEANPNLKNWIRQRSRWIKGYMQTYLVHMRNPLEYLRRGAFYEMFSFQIVVGCGIGVMLINPFMWILLIAYMISSSQAINIYHVLFLGPILYLSAFCLIFGNLFYIYLYLLACMKRKLYFLLPTTLLVPIYWLLMSVAAFFAFYELLVKPHYWQKTVHGLHLKKKQAVPQAPSQSIQTALVSEPTMRMPVPSSKNRPMRSISSVTGSLKAMPTQLMPAVSAQQKRAQVVAQRARVRDLWLVATVVITCLTSLLSCWYFFQHQQILLYHDSYSHMRIARSVFDSLTPGLAQLGGVWLPLPHILMIPFIWNDFLWHSGLAGSFVSMVCYVLSAIFLFLSIRHITSNSGISFVGTLAFIFNPNVLYLQATPLSELVCIATFTITGYFFLLWATNGQLKYLVLTTASTFLMTLARYDGWAIFAALVVLIPLISLCKRERLTQVLANFLFFTLFGGFGILLWLAWNQIIFNDPLFFQHSVFSSQGSQMGLMTSHTLYAYHDVLLSIETYTLDAMENFGNILFIAAMASFVIFFVRKRITPSMLAMLVFAVPFVFYIFSLYTGQAAIWLPGVVPANAKFQLYNVRYGSAIIVPAVLSLSIMIARLSTKLKSRGTALLRLAFLVVIIAQAGLTASSGVIDIQDGQYGLSCTLMHPINAYLAQHYNGGKVLMDVSMGDYSLSESGIDFKNIIYDGSGQYWKNALAYPAETVDWVLINVKPGGDEVSHSINITSPEFQSQFTLVVSEQDNIVLYHRNSGTPLYPLHPVPPAVYTSHNLCPNGEY